MINRSRRYIDAIPLHLSLSDISEYVGAYDPPMPRYQFDACIMALDNAYLDDAMKKRKA